MIQKKRLQERDRDLVSKKQELDDKKNKLVEHELQKRLESDKSQY